MVSIKSTIEQIMAELDSLGIAYNANADKATLLALVPESKKYSVEPKLSSPTRAILLPSDFVPGGLVPWSEDISGVISGVQLGTTIMGKPMLTLTVGGHCAKVRREDIVLAYGPFKSLMPGTEIDFSELRNQYFSRKNGIITIT